MKLSDAELREMYRDDYVADFPQEDNGRLARLLPYIDLKGDDRVLDLACGSGLWLEFIHANIQDYVGIDFSSEFIEEANKRYLNSAIQNAQFVCDDIISYSDENPDSFNKIFALDFSEHIYDDDFLKILTSVRKSLKNDGTLYIHTPNREYLIEMAKHNGVLKNHPGHIAVRNASQLCSLLSRAGFSEQQVYYPEHYVPLLRRFHFLAHLPIVGRYFRARLFIASRVK